MPVFPGCQSVHMYNTQVDQIIYSADPTVNLAIFITHLCHDATEDFYKWNYPLTSDWLFLSHNWCEFEVYTLSNYL